MSALAIQKEVSLTVDQAIDQVTAALKEVGFGILTRIDFDQKIKEKLNETLPRTVILGACNPRLAFEAYRQSTDVALLIPCNIVVRETSKTQCQIEAIRPTQMLSFLKDVKQNDLVQKAEADLERVLSAL